MKKNIKCKTPQSAVLKIDDRTKRNTQRMLKQLQPLEDWLKNDEAMAVVKYVFGDPVEFYEKFRNELVALTQ